jgi:methionyl-tRNA formyltransferase
MRVVFAGTPLFAVPTLEALLGSEHEVIAVVAQPDRPAGRGQHLVSPPTVLIAREQGIPVLQPRALRSGPFPDRWCALGADVAVVVAYGRILTPALLQAPRLGCVNVHASLLPRYRGAAPIQWAVARGEEITGVTTMQMSEGLDEGPVLLQQATRIDPEETAEDLAFRLSRLGARLLLETLSCLPETEARPQDSAEATFAPPLRKEDGTLDWRRPARELLSIVRGMCPWPGAWTRFRDCAIRVHRARVVESHEDGGPPGRVLESGARLIVATGEGVLELLEIQPACRKRQTGREMVCGAHILPGEVFQ